MNILVARDEAFSFTYKANLDALSLIGTVRYFSLLHDTTLPPCDFLYIPGGYPELYARQLSENGKMRSAVYGFAVNGGHILAECGGFMYLCTDIDHLSMCGVLPMHITMQGAHLHLGYRQLQLPDGQILRGHEFHYSSASPCQEDSLTALPLQTASGRPVSTSLYRYMNVLAGYTHWYWAEYMNQNPSFLLNLWNQL